MTKPILYFDDRSPPVRSCLMLIKMLDLDVNYKFIDLFKGEQFHEDFIRVNPLHTVPTLVDGELILTDSHVILLHLCKNAKNQALAISLAPPTYEERMRLMNVLFFECSLLFRRDSDLMSEIVRKGFANIDLTYHKRKLNEIYSMMEQFLKRHDNMAGNNLTIADLSIAPTLSTVNMMFPVATGDWPLLQAWFRRIQNLPEYDINRNGLQKLRSTIEDIGKFEFPVKIN